MLTTEIFAQWDTVTGFGTPNFEKLAQLALGSAAAAAQ
jgi:hypothetical protein